MVFSSFFLLSVSFFLSLSLPPPPKKKKKKKKKINQDANLFIGRLDAGAKLDFELKADRQAYIVCLEGNVTVGTAGQTEQLDTGDAADAVSPSTYTFTAGDAAHVMIWEMHSE